ncbi:UDP-N-acetylglucosamine pyrophosphorylase [Oribacterium sp. oral taxon 102]|uniref:UDP-N-acetylglucosamine pyrophosphorylase n=1 Tax=Oribacterium sp. oral taxon 102 TaxID=671214 RepID=UPI0015B8358E|nr:UDP-N-acetylglucosamine pyrophosphorylase [Oribacterium sp. oral taxon 102]NWO21522.1 UDP-N-acetylglucosamine pyrophosphorylase [Oribacterium sp. oral taxon 102]
MTREELKISNMYDLRYTEAALFAGLCYPWEALPRIHDFIAELGPKLPTGEYEERMPHVWVHRTARIADSVSLSEYIIIGAETELRQCAFLRGNILIGRGCVVGNSCELKNSVLFDKVQVPHYNYVGDSVLGHRSHMGAASLTSNVRSDKKPVRVHASDGDIETGLKKFGAMLSDHVEVGCGSVLNPGCCIGAHTDIYPLSSVRGCVPAHSIYKSKEAIVTKAEE